MGLLLANKLARAEDVRAKVGLHSRRILIAMRHLVLITVLMCWYPVFAQSDSSSVRYRNEVGTDFTGFLRQFLSWGGSTDPGYNYYVPNYMVTYRYHLKNWNIRAAVGAEFSDQDQPTPYEYGPETYASSSAEVSLRVGGERYAELGKRWQVYYGLDVRPSWSQRVDDAQYWNGGYSNGYESKVVNTAIAPLLGVRFRIAKRFSILTESSWAVMWSTTKTRRYYSAVIEGYPELPEERDEKRAMRSVFQSPLSVVATFDL